MGCPCIGMGKTVKMSFEGKSQHESGWQMDRILINLKKRKRPKGFIRPCTGVKYYNIQTCLLLHAADSVERLQDHWSSGFFIFCKFWSCKFKQFQVSDTELIITFPVGY